MAGIFISYRRSEAGWAGHLFADLERSFSADLVFMDTQEDIPRGGEFSSAITGALEECDALLALIGPEWICCRHADGTRRLDTANDWVRNEISTALRRGILVMPVLLGGARLPEEGDLPEDLRALRAREAAEVTDKRWDYDVGKLIKDLAKQVRLAIRDDVTAAKTGIRLLEDLIARIPAVAEAVGGSKEALENTYQQIARLVLFKKIHDSLHAVEFACLRPLESGGPTSKMRPFKVRFAGEAHKIEEAIKEGVLPAVLCEQLQERLESVATLLEAATTTPGEAAYGRVVGKLNNLLSGIPWQLDLGISTSAAGLNLDRLLTLMGTVRDTLPAAGGRQDPELEPFVQGLDALSRLRDELARRVLEHGQLQRIDGKLRSVCVPGTELDELKNEWKRIKGMRSKLVPPFSPEIDAVNDMLGKIESDIEDDLRDGKEVSARDHLDEYFLTISSVFRDVDTALKDFCLRLSSVGQPLKTILGMC